MTQVYFKECKLGYIQCLKCLEWLTFVKVKTVLWRMADFCSFYPLAFQAEGVLSLPASVHLSICPSVCPWTFPCPHDNSSQIQAGITKFAPNMHLGILLSGIENRGHGPWHSRSFWPFWLRSLGNSTCPDDKSSQISARITKFAPNMHPGILLAGIENKVHWPWPLMSFCPFRPRILGNLACLHNN